MQPGTIESVQLHRTIRARVIERPGTAEAKQQASGTLPLQQATDDTEASDNNTGNTDNTDNTGNTGNTTQDTPPPAPAKTIWTWCDGVTTAAGNDAAGNDAAGNDA